MKSKIIYTAAALIMGSIANAKGDVPKTLFELSGVARPDIRLERSILIVIDAQEEYSETGKIPLVGIRTAVKAIRSLLAQARKKGVPIVHVVHEGGPGGLFDPTSTGFKAMPGLEPLANETVIIKHLPNAFSNTTLLKELERLGNDRTLIFVGFMTHMCITSTASAALDLGFQSAVVKDAVVTRNLRGPNGETVSAQQVNQASLAALQDRISWIIESRDVLTEK